MIASMASGTWGPSQGSDTCLNYKEGKVSCQGQKEGGNSQRPHNEKHCFSMPISHLSTPEQEPALAPAVFWGEWVWHLPLLQGLVLAGWLVASENLHSWSTAFAQIYCQTRQAHNGSHFPVGIPKLLKGVLQEEGVSCQAQSPLM